MPTVLFAIIIAGLFWLDRDSSLRTSKALWLSTIWLLQVGSRPFSVWLDIDPPPAEIPGQPPAGSQFDQIFAAMFILLGAIVLIRRRERVRDLLKASWPVALYFSFALVSLLWSDFPAWGFKRWIRALGELAMVLIVATDAQPITALRRLFSRIGFVLLPASVLLIYYYPDLGQDYGFNNGVTTNKNILGDLVYLVMLASLWQVLSLIRDRNESNRARRLVAQCTLLAFGIWLLFLADCATAVACVILGALLMLATSLPLIGRRAAAVHVLVLGVLLVGGLTKLVGGTAVITGALGRQPDLTGRDRVWDAVIPMVPNPLGGAGFETFWVGPRVVQSYRMIGGPHPTNEAHNGYIEVYLNLGWLGLGLIALILGQGYGRAVEVFRRDSALGALLVAYVVTAVFYNYSEAGFRMISLGWFCLLLAVVMASRVMTMVEGRAVSTRNDCLQQPSFDTSLPTWWGSPQLQVGPRNLEFEAALSGSQERVLNAAPTGRAIRYLRRSRSSESPDFAVGIHSSATTGSDRYQTQSPKGKALYLAALPKSPEAADEETIQSLRDRLFGTAVAVPVLGLQFSMATASLFWPTMCAVRWKSQRT